LNTDIVALAVAGLARNRYVIEIREYPISINDAFIIAHEIEHLVRARKNKPLRIRKRDYPFVYLPELLQALRNLLEDPVVDKILKEKYCFDLSNQYQKDVDFIRNKLERTSSSEPKDPLAKIVLMFRYSQKVLQLELVKNEDVFHKWIDYQLLFKSRYPLVSEMSDELLSIIREIGLDTPKKQKALFNRIIEYYEIKDYLYLI